MVQVMNYFQVKDWHEYQHYKDRNPPWIKLNTDTFTKYKFGQLSDASKLLAVCIWTLASRYEDPKLGIVPADLEYIKRQCNLGDMVQLKHLKELVDQGYIIDASNTLADCKQVASPETETYKEETYSKETELLFEKNFSQFWDFFPEVNRKKGSRKKAKESFKTALKKDDFNQIIQGVDMYAKHIRFVGQSNADAFRWLADERWRDNWTLNTQQRKPTDTKREYEEAAVRGMCRAENPDF